jgi:hypothetical protein
MTHSALEKLLETDGSELLRRLLEDHLAPRAAQEGARGRTGPVVGADGRERPQQRNRERALMTVFGPVAVPRIGFAARGSASLFPLDGELNLPPGSYSYGVVRRCAEEAAKTSFDESVNTPRTTTGAATPKRQLEDLVVRGAIGFEAFYATRTAPAADAVAQHGPLLADQGRFTVEAAERDPALRPLRLRGGSSPGRSSASASSASPR